MFALWSAPRSRSTAFFRSMLERGDLLALHEPLEGLVYLGPLEISDRTFETAGSLLDWLVDGGSQVDVFVKETVNRPVLDLVVSDRRALSEIRHAFLIRRPEEIAASWWELEQEMRIHDTGVEALHELYSAVFEAGGHPPVVIDSDDLLARPHATMASYCRAVGLPFIADALRWEAGERAEWERTARWHQDAGASRGFEPPKPVDPSLQQREEVARFVTRHRPFYDELRARRLETAPSGGQPA